MAYFGNKPSDQAIKIGENTILSSMIDDGVIVNADINSSASIDATKLADGTITSTELQYINTLSSNAQTQLNAKAPIASPTFTGNFTSVGIDDNADALALTIDSSERVGLGQPSPICKLHIKDSNPIVAIDRQANDEKVSLNFISRDTVNYGQWGIVMNHSGADTTTPDFSFYNYYALPFGSIMLVITTLFTADSMALIVINTVIGLSFIYIAYSIHRFNFVHFLNNLWSS